MPRKTKPTPTDEYVAPVITEEAAAVEATPEPTAQQVDIFNEDGTLHRTYSLEVHGPDFAKLADQFLAGHPKFHK